MKLKCLFWSDYLVLTGYLIFYSYFVLQFVVPPKALHDLEDEYSRDVDIVRRCIFKMELPEEIECTLHEEIQPPAYRYALYPRLIGYFCVITVHMKKV